MMKLYVHPMSSNARRAQMTAILLGTPVETVFVDLQKGAQRSADYLALNPNGRVPTLVDDDFTLWESLAITKYLAEKTPGQTLYPTDARGKAVVDQWLSWAGNHWSAAIAQLNFENFLKGMFGMGEPNAYAVERAEALFKDYAKTLDTQLGKTRFIVGETMTLADVAMAAPLMYVQLAKLPVEGLTSLGRWLEEMKATEAWKQTEPRMG